MTEKKGGDLVTWAKDARRVLESTPVGPNNEDVMAALAHSLEMVEAKLEAQAGGPGHATAVGLETTPLELLLSARNVYDTGFTDAQKAALLDGAILAAIDLVLADAEPMPPGSIGWTEATIADLKRQLAEARAEAEDLWDDTLASLKHELEEAQNTIERVRAALEGPHA